MNRNSYICSYISEHLDTWEHDIKDKVIRMSDETEPNGHRYVSFNYFNGCDFTDPIVQEARGIIIDVDTLDVVCWPFRKFGNYGEGYVDKIDWNSARVQDKEDGSICKLWYDFFQNTWRWSTNSCIDASQAGLEYKAVNLKTYMDAIKHADNYDVIHNDIQIESLDKECTYIFELVGPYNRVVISYPQEDLWHIGTRNNRTGKESVTDIGIHHPKEYPLHTVDDCIQAAIKLNPNNSDVTREGFVVVDDNWHRIKIKSPAYVMIHHAITNRIPKKDAVEFILGGGSLSDVQSLENIMLIKYYDYRMTELELQVQRYIDYIHGLAEELEHDRKAIANTIKNDRFSFYGFRCLESEEITAHNLLFEFKSSHEEKHLLDLIPDYQVNVGDRPVSM